MMPGMGMPGMNNAAMGTPAAPAGGAAAAAAPKAIASEHDAELANCTAEDLAALEIEVELLEADEKKNAKKDAYVGLMARYIEDQGFGFIACPECKELWEKTDIYVSGRTFLTSGANVGDMVTFRVERGGTSPSGKGMARAVLPEILPKLTNLRKKLIRMREVLRERKQAKQVNAGGGACGSGNPALMGVPPPRPMGAPLATPFGVTPPPPFGMPPLNAGGCIVPPPMGMPQGSPPGGCGPPGGGLKRPAESMLVPPTMGMGAPMDPPAKRPNMSA